MKLLLLILCLAMGGCVNDRINMARDNMRSNCFIFCSKVICGNDAESCWTADNRMSQCEQHCTESVISDKSFALWLDK